MTGIERLVDIVNDGPYSGGMIHISVQKLREICEQIEREVDDISGRGSDILAWVEAHGGLDAVRERLMPEGMEWPRFETGEPVRVGDEAVDEAEELVYRVSEIAFSDGYGTCLRYEDQRDGNSYNFIDGLEPGDRVKRPAPPVLDADGVEIRVGDVLYRKSDGCMVKVAEVYEKTFIDAAGCVRPGDGFTHRAPVLAADGEPLEVGQTVYHIADGKEYTVEKLFEDGAMVTPDGITGGRYMAEYLTHQNPDSWDRLEEDANKNPFDYCKDVGHRLDTCENSEAYKARDLVRRAKSLAGVSE